MLFASANLMPATEQAVRISEFDFAVIRYIWTSNSGRDLDTRTRITSPYYSNDVGWGRSSSVTSINPETPSLKWGGDNTNSGVECILINLKALQETYPNDELFEFRMNAFWYGERNSGDITIQFESYKNGSMQQRGYDFVNVGGVPVQNIVIPVNVFTRQSANIEGDLLAKLSFNTRTLRGSLNSLR